LAYFAVTTDNGPGGFQTANISFYTYKHLAYTGPGNITLDTSNAYTGNITLNAKGNVNINGTAIYINNPLNTVGILSSVNTSTFTTPPINFVNTNAAPNTTLSVLGPNMGALAYNGIEVGQSDTTGNTGSFNFQWAGNNNASNKIFIEFFGGGGTNLTLYNSTSTGALFNSNLSAIQYTSTVAIGTAPIVVTSTTLVPNLYVARSALADTCTTIPALTGDVTSAANVTTYNNALPITLGGTGVVGGLASPGTIGGTVAGIVNATTVAATSTVTGTQLISNIAIGTAPIVVTSTTLVALLNVSQLLGKTWAIPGTIGSTTPSTGAFTTLSTTDDITTQKSVNGALQLTLQNTNAGTGAYALIAVANDVGSSLQLYETSSTFSATYGAKASIVEASSGSTALFINKLGATSANNTIKIQSNSVTGFQISNTSGAITTTMPQYGVGLLTSNSGGVITSANLSGDIVSAGGVTTYTNAVPIAKGGTGVVGGMASPGTIGGTVAGIVNATTVVATSTVTGTQLISNIAIGTAPIVVTSTTLVPNLYVAKSALADTCTTNANLTGDVTSVGNATTYANAVPIAKGGTGVVGGLASPGTIGGTVAGIVNATTVAATSTVTGTQLISNIAIGTAPIVVTSTTLVPNLYVAKAVLADSATTNANLTGDVTSVGNATTYANAVPIAKGGTGVVGGMASPGTIGGTVAGIVNATTVAATSTVTGTQLISNIAIGTAPIVVTSTTLVSLLNVSQLLGNTWAIPGTIGSTTANTGAFTTLNTSNTTSTYASASVTFTNTNVDPQSSVAILAPNMTSGKEVDLFIGQSLGTGNAGTLGFVYSGNNNAASFTYVGPWGGATRMKFYSNTAKTEVNSSLSATSYLSTATLGSALTSILKAPNIVSNGAGSGTYTVSSPAPLYVRFRMWGGGGGGGGSGGASGRGNGSNGGDSTIVIASNTWKSAKGTGGFAASQTGGSGGTATSFGGATLAIFNYGNTGGSPKDAIITGNHGGEGGGSFGSSGGTTPETSGNNANQYGGGGSGATDQLIAAAGAGGGGGGYMEWTITTLAAAATNAWVVGSGGAGGTAGTSGFTGGSGSDGRLIIEEYWQ